jgi:flavorubredoxin
LKKVVTLYESGDHTWQVIARDPERQGHLIDTNEYVIASGGAAILTDPGGQEIFPAVFSALNEAFDPRKITHIFASHQDPDVISSLALWLAYNPALRCYASWLWSGFIPHFGGDAGTIISLPDHGGSIEVGKIALDVVPAHYLHSSGNFHLYDRKAKMLFTGDVGAALLPESENNLFVQDFDSHTRYAEGFHRRWMGSAAAKRDWCERVSKLPIDMLCPQHGAIYKGKDVQRFISWFDGLEVGVLKS